MRNDRLYILTMSDFGNIKYVKYQETQEAIGEAESMLKAVINLFKKTLEPLNPRILEPLALIT